MNCLIRIIIPSLLIAIFSNIGDAQGVALSNTESPPRPGTILDITATNLAVSLPWADTALIQNPQKGFIIYDPDAAAIYQYNGSHWLRLLDATTFNYYYADRDGDGFGDRFSALYAIEAIPGYVADSTDCNDTNANISPGLAELCDGIDNDCDQLSSDGDDEALIGTPCDGPDADQCMEGTWICAGGTLSCTDTTGDSMEICDSLDNDCDGMIDEGCTPVFINWGNIEFPASTSTTVITPTTPIFGQVYADGVTELPGQGPGIIAQLGYGADGSDPALGGWTWVNATFNTDVINNDQYMATLTISTPGTYDYAYRYSGDGGVTWLYCDFGAGSSNGYAVADAGDLVVNP